MTTLESPFPPGCARQFEAKRVLSSGAFGVVYLATQVELGREVAIKLLHGHMLSNEDALNRFRAEAKVTARLRHPNIVTVIQYAIENGVPWIAYEYLPGMSLQARLKQGLVPREAVLGIADQIAAGLEEAHANDVLHRDIKPANILATNDGGIKVVDFGLARWTPQVTSLTATGLVVGTPAYLAPELIEGGDCTVQSDIFALGVTVFELLTGSPAAVSNTCLWQTLLSKGQLPRVADVWPAAPGGIDDVLRELLAPRPKDRPRSATEVRQAFARLASGAPPQPAVAAVTPRALGGPAQPARPGAARPVLKPTPAPTPIPTRSRARYAVLAALPLAAFALAALSRQVTVVPPRPESASPGAARADRAGLEMDFARLVKRVEGRARTLNQVMEALTTFGVGQHRGLAQAAALAATARSDFEADARDLRGVADRVLAGVEGPEQLATPDLALLARTLAQDCLLRLRTDRLTQAAAILRELEGSDTTMDLGKILRRCDTIRYEGTHIPRVHNYLEALGELLARAAAGAPVPAASLLEDLLGVSGQFRMYPWRDAFQRQFEEQVVPRFVEACGRHHGSSAPLARAFADALLLSQAKNQAARREREQALLEEFRVLRTAGALTDGELAALGDTVRSLR